MPRLAIDIGGTFTDLFVYDEGTGEITVAKGPTTPEDPSLGVVNVIAKAGVAMGEVVSSLMAQRSPQTRWSSAICQRPVY